MKKLADCCFFYASVEEFNGKFYVIVSGRFGMSIDDFESRIVRQKDFGSKKACMDFFNNFADTDYKFDEDDFEFVSHRYISINYFGCGVDFDED